MNITPPELTKSELETFLSRVQRWEKNETHLQHIWFEQSAVNYVHTHGYGFEKVKDNRSFYYRAIKLK